jgi:hypothetical protein
MIISATYRKRSDKVQAVQYVQAHAVEVQKILSEWGLNTNQNDKGLLIEYEEHHIQVKEGDYVVKDSFGKISSMPSSRYHDLYELDI